MHSMNKMDEALLQAFPLLAASTAGEQEPAAAFGTRYLVGREGVSREITLPWIRVRQLIAPSALPLPYGQLGNAVEFRCGPLPSAMLRAFVADAKQAQLLEIAGVFLWNETDGSWRYARRESKSASTAHVAYDEVRPAQGEHLVVDVHSHGLHAAFFSAADDIDDAGSMKVSLVLGNLDRERPSTKMRLCMAGTMQPAYLDGQGRLGVIA